MKTYVSDFCRRGAAVCGIGPLVLAVLYLILHHSGVLHTLTVRQVCTGIFSLTALAFIAGGLNALYAVERLPLPLAILIHGGVLYGGYLATYLLNGWLEWGPAPVVVFSAVFAVGYLVIWAIIYAIVRRNTARVNALLEQQRQASDQP